MGGDSGQQTQQKQFQKIVTSIVANVLNETNTTSNVSNHPTSQTTQNVQVSLGTGAKLLCLGGVSATNEIAVALQNNMSVLNGIDNRVEQDIPTRIATLMSQMLDSEIARGSGGGTVGMPLIATASWTSGYQTVQEMHSEIQSSWQSSVKTAVSSIVTLRTQMAADTAQNVQIKISGTMLALGKCKSDNILVGQLRANTIAEQVVDSLSKQGLTQHLVNTHTAKYPDTTNGVMSFLQSNAIWILGMLIAVLVISRFGKGVKAGKT